MVIRQALTFDDVLLVPRHEHVVDRDPERSQSLFEPLELLLQALALLRPAR